MTSYKKLIFTFFLAIFALMGVVTPRPANAFSPFVVAVNKIKMVWEKVEKAYDKVQGTVGAELSNRTVSMFLDSFAYDVATELASGGEGGKPLFRISSIKKSLRNAGDKALGDFVGELTSKNFADLGLNLCDPSIDLKLSLTLALIDEEKPPKPKCSWSKLRKNWEQFGDEVQADIIKFELGAGKTTSTAAFFDGILSKSDSPLGIAFKLNNKVIKLKSEAVKVEELTAVECKGFMDKTTTISGDIVQTCAKVMKMGEVEWAMAFQASQQTIEERKAAATNKSLASILKDASNKFVNTFASKVMKRFVKGSWSLFGSEENDIYQDYRNTLIDRLRGGSNIRQPRGADIFKEFKTVNIETLESFDYISDFTICPNEFRGPDNCVMSPAFLQVVNNKITIQQAIDQGIINGDTPFVHPDDAINHTVDKCYRDGLCYSNLVKLRKANMIPVGWELAALRAPVSIQQAIDCFEENVKCDFAMSADYGVEGNDHNPFYHLVDPDWVMKAPAVRCDAYVFSSILESSESSNRKQYCADPKVCLQEDEEGNCLDDQFNYCIRSENTWNFKGESCVAGDIYAGCLTFNNKDFGNNSYIQDTLEYCNASQAGCNRYSQDKDSNNGWVLEDVIIDPNDLFLNRQAVECNQENVGCTEYIALAPDLEANLVPNGSFDDLDGDDFPDGWSGDGINDLAVGLEYDGDRVPNGYSFGAGGYPSSETVSMPITLLPNTMYRLSGEAAQYDSSRTDAARIALEMCDDVGNCSNNTSLAAAIDGNCDLTSGGNSHIVAIPSFIPASTDMERNSCTFMTNDRAAFGTVTVLSNGADPAALWFDNIKLEIISSLDNVVISSYSPYGDGAKIYMNGDTVMCSADEVGCQGYNPVNDDPMIPAVITQGDLCPSECVGYATFTEQANTFDAIEGNNFVEYYNFIPGTARQCPEQEAGCEEFTNLDVVAEGGEGREYFTYLRQCVEESLGEIYYTWEGTDVAGYQIKTWNALPSSVDAAPCTNMAPAGDVCLDITFIDDGIAQANEVAACGSETGDPDDDPENNSNCREFFDINGDVHYRFQDKVIFATDNCHDYRRATTDQIYKAVPEESIHCSESNNGCSSYYGNNANNSRVVLNDTFEQGSYAPWEGGNIDLSNESLSNNGHSLRVNSGSDLNRDMMDTVLQNNREYVVSWWMKNDTIITNFYLLLLGNNVGNVNNNPVWSLSELFANADEESVFQNIEPGRWHYYTASAYVDSLTPEHMEDIVELEFRIMPIGSLQGQDVYIDNFMVKEVENSFSAVKNSWNTPLSCDDPYTGYNLGCQAYTDLNGQNFNLKSFDHLCREEAIGCMPVIDTNNSTNPFEEVFHVGDYSSTTVATDELTYLVPNPNNYCPENFKGCSELGLPDRLDDTEFSTVYKINDPDKYDTIMCDFEGLGCTEYNTAKGVFYLKDPGTNTCTYQQNVLIASSTLSGWFRTSTLGDLVPLGCADTDDNPYIINNIYDVADLILPIDNCVDLANAPLNFFTRDDCEDNSGQWINYSVAAQCPASENLCTSFRDPADPINCDPKINDLAIEGYCSDFNYSSELSCVNNNAFWTPRCKDYYYYDNSKIDERSCNGLVDRQDGCVLFYDANNWDGEHNQVITIYDTNETYENIEVDNRAASPVTCDPSFDPNCKVSSNKLIKVNKDRQCAEWLACKSSTAVKDSKDEYKIICDDLDTCLEFDYDTDSNITKCKKWGSYDEDVEALTFEKYQSRDTGLKNHISWSDKEYTGYSIPNMLPVNKLSVYEFGDITNSVKRLVYNVVNSVDGSGSYYADCVDGSGNSLDGQACTAEINTDGDYYFKGECQQRVCWVGPKVNTNSTSTYSLETRAYSIADAPFPAAIEPEGVNRISKYNMANICIRDDDPNSCEDSFKKVTFGSNQEVLYYSNKPSAKIPNGICISGDAKKIGQDCEEPYKNYNCDSIDELGNPRGDGFCSLKTEEIVFQNWPGICLEYDKDNSLVKDVENSYYCNQWYPAQKIKGTASLYDNYREAGYYELSGRDALFCAVAEPYLTTEDRYYCGYFDGAGQCNVLMKVPSGSKINLDIVASYSGLLDEGSWMEDEDFLFRTWDDNNNVGKDFIRPRNVGDLSAKFIRGIDFIISDELISTTDFMDIIDTMFDATAVAGNPGIHRFYFDDNVAPTGVSSGSTFVSIPSITLYEHRGDRSQCPYPNIYDCPAETHSLKSWCKKDTPLFEKDWYNGGIWCNPYIYNYYVDLNSGPGTYTPPDPIYVGSCTSDCRFTNASTLNANHGRGCLQDTTLAPTYSGILSSYTNATGVFDQAVCAASENDNDCAFVNCVENLDIANQNDANYCRDYTTCFQYIVDTTDNVIASPALHEETVGCFSDGYYDDDNNPATPRILLWDGEGPLNSLFDSDPDSIAKCKADNIEDFTYRFTGTVDEAGLDELCNTCALVNYPETHASMESGVDCDAVDPINCYQQCSVVSQLDSEGLLSAVRTDIWWRNEKNRARVNQIFPWVSWYWSPTGGYVTSSPNDINGPNANDDEVLYGNIAGLENVVENYPGNFSHFGAGLDRFRLKSIVSTRVPYYKASPDNITAGTFFGYSTGDVNSALATALLEMQDLFYRVYNLNWVTASSTYVPMTDPGPNFELAAGNGGNNFAGQEYNPRILATCGDSLCETLDANGDVVAVKEGVTINNITEGNLVGQDSSLFVSAKFFYHAHPDHMPIYSVGVDWGDGPTTVNNFSLNPGKYRNSLPAEYCNPNKDAPGLAGQLMGFAGEEGACQSGYKIFYHDYLYDNTGNHPCNNSTIGTVIPTASCYQPRIQVWDNWRLDTIMPFDGWIIVYEE